MNDNGFELDVAVVGAGRIGLPWSAVLAANHGLRVTCVDIAEDVVEEINLGVPPFEEPDLDSYLGRAVEEGLLTATTDPAVVSDHRYVVFTMNAPRNEMYVFLDAIETYGSMLTGDQVVINRTTVPVGIVDRMKRVIDDSAEGKPAFAVFPERLAEGKAIEEIETLPKVVGVSDDRSEVALRELLEPFECPLLFTDPKTAMFTKLIDNSYRDGLFAIANQIAYTAEELGLDAHEAIELANSDYPRNEIPKPGTVGGKCLPKDPHFLTDETVCDQPTTPDLFNATRRTNAAIPSYIATEIFRKQPSKVAVLGLSYKRDVADTANSPAVQIKDILDAHGAETVGYDPYLDRDEDLRIALEGVDVVLIAVNHSAFEDLAPMLDEHCPANAEVYDVWNTIRPEEIQLPYDGFGLRST